ncbi:MAG: SPASM domain-containing protein [archaeon]
MMGEIIIPSIRGGIFSEKEKAEARRNNEILFISPMLNGTCQLKCFACYTESDGSMKREFSFEELKETLKEAKNHGAKTVRIAGIGEPFLDNVLFNQKENTFPLLDVSEELGMQTVVFTNGVIFNKNPNLLERLYDRNISLLFKLWGTKDTHDYLTVNRGGDLEPWIKNDELFVPKGLDYAIKLGFNKVEYDNQNNAVTRLGIETCLFKENKNFLPEGLRWARRNYIFPHFEQPFVGGRMQNNLDKRVGDKEALKISEELLKIDKKEFNDDWKPGLPYLLSNTTVFGEARCDKRDYNLVVNLNGDVWACYGTPIIYGNILKNSFDEIMNHPFRKKILESKVCCGCQVSALSEMNGDPVKTPDDLNRAAKKYDYKG